MAFIPFIGPLLFGAAGAAAPAAAGAAAGGLSLGSLGSIASLAGTGVSAAASLAAGAGAKAAAKSEALQLEQQAAESKAIGQRQAIEERRKGELVLSQQRAAAAAGGASTDDPGILELMLDTAETADMNARMAQYQGEAGAQRSMFAADMRRLEGKQAWTGGLLGAAGTALSGLGSLSRYSDPLYRSYAAKYG